MLSFYSILTITLSCLLGAGFASEDTETIGKQIFFNECSSKTELLVTWNSGEDFASLGIGHFIWYPQDKKGPFQETFPLLIAFLETHGSTLPAWLKSTSYCPWNTREEFLEKNSGQKKELIELLSTTIPLQTAFIEKQFGEQFLLIMDSLPPEKKHQIEQHVVELQKTIEGRFALIDYTNFKGSGMLSSENYQGRQWGLKQVLEEMPSHPAHPLTSFIATAKTILKDRVSKAPPERHEERWLSGWIARIDRYQTSGSLRTFR